MTRAFRVAQISDQHLFADKNHEFLGLNSYASFLAVMELVEQENACNPFDLIMLTGDIAQDATLVAYQNLGDVFKNFNIPIAWIPGNHDEPNVMDKSFGSSTLTANKHFILNNWQLIFLDSHWDRRVAGFLANDQLKFLEEKLAQYSENALIILHHNVLPVGSAWLDQHTLHNNKEFFSTIQSHSQVKGVICGHVHQFSEQIWQGIRFISCPSTSIQFKPNCEKFQLDDCMPGFNVYTLNENGTFEVEVKRILFDKKFVPDLKSKGY